MFVRNLKFFSPSRKGSVKNKFPKTNFGKQGTKLKFCLPFGLVVLLSFLGGCAIPKYIENTRIETRLKEALTKYRMESPKVKIGDSKDRVLEILEPTQAGLDLTLRRPPEMLTIQNVDGSTSHIEIVYYRTGWQSDGLLTDDELTPYVFKDGILTSVGWTALGGPKTSGKVQHKSTSVVATPPPATPPYKTSFTCIDLGGGFISCN